MEDIDSFEGPVPKPSHHKNQMDAYCYCKKCKGKAKQKPSVIDDHRLRYGRQTPSPERVDDRVARVGRAEGPAPSRSPRQTPLASHSVQDPLLRAENPDELNRRAAPFMGADERGPPHSPFDELPPARPLPQHADNLPVAEPHESDEELDIIPEIPRLYRFDQLLDEEQVAHHARADAIDDDYPMYEYQEDDDDVIELDGDCFDENFGLPEGDDDPPTNVNERPIFQYPVDEEPNDDPDGEPDPEGNPGAQYTAFQEPALIRNIYIDAFIQKSLYGATQRALKHQLKSARRTLTTHPDIQVEDIARMAQSISTVEKRLGVDTDRFITTYNLCPVCKRRYSPEYIDEAVDNRCLNAGCTGVLFLTRRLASGSQRRVSNLTYPFASPIAWIRHVLNLPGAAELVQSWRNKPGDRDGLSAPTSSREWMEDLDINRPLTDISDGWGWRSTEAKLQRLWDPITRSVSDETTKEGSYSVGACYLAIDNLPRHMRFLRENISLCIIMPGPNEPNDYALDQMLDPLVEELLQLQQGVRMTIRQGDPPVYQEEVIHATITQHIADLIARIKIGGGAGVKSEKNFCLYCHTLLSALSVPDGYTRRDFVYRDPEEDLNHCYQWKHTHSQEERKAMFEETGNRYTALHRLPGWHTSTSSPLDSMHLLYLGATNWIVKQVLVAPGMLNKRRPQDQDPLEIFNQSIETMWVPKNFQRLPPKLGQTRVSIKADQWKITSRVLFVPLFLALRNGDEIRDEYVPRGTASSISAKNQAFRAKLLHQQKRKYYQSLGRENECPTLEACYPSRSIRFHYRQVLRFCLGVNTIDKRSITPAETEFAQQLLELLCIDYVRNNIQLPPNFHYLMHLQEWIFKTGSVYNTHVWGMERANGIVSRIKHNGKGKGVLEGTLMRGWWSHVTLQNLIKTMRTLPDRTPADESIIDDLLVALKGGTEHALQRGTLMAFIAQCQTAYTRLHGIEDYRSNPG
ncbi:hypothetical protein RSAG8_12070, partial [Rhizoctonia solani AG-8 WAC10335]